MPKTKTKKSKYISYLLRIFVATVALYLTFRGVDLHKVADVLLGLNVWIVAALMGLWLLSQLIVVARWSLLMSVQSINIGFGLAFRLNLLGVFYNNCLPTSVGGDLLRAWYVTTHTNKKLEAALSVFVDRVIGFIGMIIMAYFCYWFIPVDDQNERLTFNFNLFLSRCLSESKWFILAAGAAFTLILITFLFNAKGRSLLRRGMLTIRVHGLALFSKVHTAIGIYCKKRLAIAFALLLTFSSKGVLIFAMWLVGREIGIHVHIKYYFVFFPMAWLLGALPISIGALGIWEGTLKLMFGKVVVGLGEHISALALCHRLIWLLGSLPGAVIHLVGAHLPKDFFADYDKPVV